MVLINGFNLPLFSGAIYLDGGMPLCQKSIAQVLFQDIPVGGS